MGFIVVGSPIHTNVVELKRSQLVSAFKGLAPEQFKLRAGQNPDAWRVIFSTPEIYQPLTTTQCIDFANFSPAAAIALIGCQEKITDISAGQIMNFALTNPTVAAALLENKLVLQQVQTNNIYKDGLAAEMLEQCREKPRPAMQLRG